MKLNKVRMLITIVSLGLGGCATSEKSTVAGAGVGSLSGAAIDSIADPGKNGELRTRNVMVGATLGAITGAAVGHLIHKGQEDARQEGIATGKSQPPGSTSNPPKLSDAKVEARWIEGRALGNRFVDAHWEYLILEPARWTEGK